MKKYIGVIYAILSSVAFGLMPIFAKFAYENGSNPTSVLVFRFGLASLILFIYLKVRKVSLKIDKKSLVLLIFIGVLGYTVTTQTLFLAYDYIGAGFATTLHFIYPVIVFIIGFLFYKEKISKSKVVSLILAALGVYALVAFGANTVIYIGVFLAVFSGISYGITVVALGTSRLKKVENSVITLYTTFGAFIGIGFYGMLDNSITLKINYSIAFSYIGIAVVSTIISLILFLKAIELIGTSSASILGTFEPIVSIIFGIVFLDEKLTYSIILGTTLILISTVILVKNKG